MQRSIRKIKTDSLIALSHDKCDRLAVKNKMAQLSQD
jgi:hypothetical protein